VKRSLDRSSSESWLPRLPRKGPSFARNSRFSDSPSSSPLPSPGLNDGGGHDGDGESTSGASERMSGKMQGGRLSNSSSPDNLRQDKSRGRRSGSLPRSTSLSVVPTFAPPPLSALQQRMQAKADTLTTATSSGSGYSRHQHRRQLAMRPSTRLVALTGGDDEDEDGGEFGRAKSPSVPRPYMRRSSSLRSSQSPARGTSGRFTSQDDSSSSAPSSSFDSSSESKPLALPLQEKSCIACSGGGGGGGGKNTGLSLDGTTGRMEEKTANETEENIEKVGSSNELGGRGIGEKAAEGSNSQQQQRQERFGQALQASVVPGGSGGQGAEIVAQDKGQEASATTAEAAEGAAAATATSTVIAAMVAERKRQHRQGIAAVPMVSAAVDSSFALSFSSSLPSSSSFVALALPTASVPSVSSLEATPDYDTSPLVASALEVGVAAAATPVACGGTTAVVSVQGVSEGGGVATQSPTASRSTKSRAEAASMVRTPQVLSGQGTSISEGEGGGGGSCSEQSKGPPDPREGNRVTFQFRGNSEEGVVLKRTGLRIRVQRTSIGASCWVEVKDVVAVHAASNSGVSCSL